jgi:hypothetical protein
MLLRNRCGELSRQDKAIFNPRATLKRYQPEINDARRYWQGEAEQARATGNGVLVAMGRTVVDRLTETSLAWNELARNPDAPGNRIGLEQARRLALSTLGISMLLRQEWADSPAVAPDIVGEDGQVGTILDMVVDTHAWKDFRVHTPIIAEGAIPEGANEQWYKEGGLWVRQVRPADPTGYLKNEFLPAMGVDSDFSRFETIFPYVATK